MKEKETRKLYNSMTNVKEDYIEEAWKEKAKGSIPYGLSGEWRWHAYFWVS